MLVENIYATVSKAPEEEEAGNQDERDQKSLINKSLLASINRKAAIHDNPVLVNTRLL
jgi:hypothetical protein